MSSSIDWTTEICRFIDIVRFSIFCPRNNHRKTYRNMKTESVKNKQNSYKNKPVFALHFPVTTQFLQCCFVATGLFSRFKICMSWDRLGQIRRKRGLGRSSFARSNAQKKKKLITTKTHKGNTL